MTASKLDHAHSIMHAAIDVLDHCGRPIRGPDDAEGHRAILPDETVIQCVRCRGRMFLDIYGEVHNGNRHKVFNMTWERDGQPVLVSFRRGPWERTVLEAQP
jgi:hypothetical protein